MFVRQADESSMRAAITPTTVGFRQSLKEEGIPFTLAGESQISASRKLVRTGSECSHSSIASEPPAVAAFRESVASEPPPAAFRESISMMEPMWLNNDPVPDSCDSGVGEEFK